MYNDYDPVGGHTQEEAAAAYEDLFNELHGDKSLFDTENKTDVYIIGAVLQSIDSVCATICYAHLRNETIPNANHMPCFISALHDDAIFVINYFLRNKSDIPLAEDWINQVYILDNQNINQENDIILVAHNNPSFQGKNIDTSKIVEIIDNHSLSGFTTPKPITVRIQPLGSVCTIVSHMFKERGVTISPYHAGLLCAGIISATDTFNSEQTTQADKLEAVTLATTAGIDIQEFAKKIV